VTSHWKKYFTEIKSIALYSFAHTLCGFAVRVKAKLRCGRLPLGRFATWNIRHTMVFPVLLAVILSIIFGLNFLIIPMLIWKIRHTF